MALKGSKASKRREADRDYSDSEDRPTKKQATSGKDGGPSSVKKGSRKQGEQKVIDLEASEQSIISRKLRNDRNGFPRFAKGEVYIELEELSEKSTYVFHQTTIKQATGVWAKDLLTPLDEADKALAAKVKKQSGPGLKVFFTLKFKPKHNVFALTKAPFTFHKARARGTLKSSMVVQGSRNSKERNDAEHHTPPASELPRLFEELESLESFNITYQDSEVGTQQESPVHNVPHQTTGDLTSHTKEFPGESIDDKKTATFPFESPNDEIEATIKVVVDQVKNEIDLTETAVTEEGENFVNAYSAADSSENHPALNGDCGPGSVLPGDLNAMTQFVGDHTYLPSAVKEEGGHNLNSNIGEDFTEKESISQHEDKDVVMAPDSEGSSTAALEVRVEIGSSSMAGDVTDSTELKSIIKNNIENSAHENDGLVRDHQVKNRAAIIDEPTDTAFKMLEPSAEAESTESPNQKLRPQEFEILIQSKSASNETSANSISPASDLVEEEDTKAVTSTVECKGSSSLKLETHKPTPQVPAVQVIRNSMIESSESVADSKANGLDSIDHETNALDIPGHALRVFRYAHGEAGGEPPTSTKTSSCPKNTPHARLKSVRAHHHLFRIWHNLSPGLSCKNASEAFDQIEEIIATAKWYECLPLASRCLIDHITQNFLPEVLQSINENPPRWLLISLDMQCAFIFKEAMVHLVGHYPYYPWIDYPSSKIPRRVLGLIRTKVDELETLKNSRTLDLFYSSIGINRESLSFPKNFECFGFQTWFVAQIWQDWLRLSTSKYHVTSSNIGTAYRRMAKGGNAYLDHRYVYEILTQRHANARDWNLEELEQDLAIMKDYAKETVQDLVVNGSMLDVEKHDIQHLTCVKITNEDIPWDTKTGS